MLWGIPHGLTGAGARASVPYWVEGCNAERGEHERRRNESAALATLRKRRSIASLLIAANQVMSLRAEDDNRKS